MGTMPVTVKTVRHEWTLLGGGRDEGKEAVQKRVRCLKEAHNNQVRIPHRHQ